MEIKDNRKYQANMEFRYLAIGEPFEWDGKLFLRCETCKKDDEEFNAVRLDTGELWHFTKDYVCQQVNASIVLENLTNKE